ncbi:MAG: pseudouridine synthase [Planctomycetota bacterium]
MPPRSAKPKKNASKKPAAKKVVRKKTAKKNPAKKATPGVAGRPAKGVNGKKKRATNGGRPGAKPGKKRRRPASAAAASAVNAREGDGRERLQKVLAAAGVASRRDCELLIQEGRVEVDNEVITELGVRVDPFKQTIRLDGEALAKAKRVYFAVNKPEGVVCTARDPSGRPRVIDLLPPDVGRVFNVGRLDLASEGLILVTNDGELANQLTHPRHGVQKLYHVQVAGHPTVETLSTLRKGVRLAEGQAHFVDARIKSRRKKSTILEVVLDEGRNREVRRVLARVDHKVQKLTRVAVGPVKLGEMPPGAYRPLTVKEIKGLRSAVDRPPRSPAEQAADGRSVARRKGTKKPARRAAKGSGRAATKKKRPGRRVLE